MKSFRTAVLLLSIFAVAAEAGVLQRTAVSPTRQTENAACSEAQSSARIEGGKLGVVTKMSDCKCHGGSNAYVCSVDFTVTTTP